MNWKNKKVLVTGAGGFIGSHLCEALINLGSEVTGMIRYNSRNDWGNLEYLTLEQKKSIKIVSGNIEDSKFVNQVASGQDIIFHLAALIAIPYSYLAPMSYIRTNIEGTMNILEAALTSGVNKIIHTSTSETYGTAIYTPIDEGHPLQGQSPYSASKIGADKIAESYFRSYNLPVATVRPFNSFGPRQSARAVIPTIITQALTMNQIKLGSLNPIRDLTYVSDTVMGFIKIAESDESVGQVVNIGTGTGFSIGEIAKKILSLLNITTPITVDEDRIRPPKSEVLELICDNSKAKNLFGWEPQISLETGLKRTIDFISSHTDIYKPDTYTL
jgi:NAD dependent epimerase/dehydratase